jgi:hypothetical protein
MRAHLKLLALACVMALFTGCATLAPGLLKPGTPISDARQVFGGPTAEYPLPDGGTRLEFRRGRFGKQTWMLDFDREGRLVKSEQVLTWPNFTKIVPGMTREDVLFRIGHPADVFRVQWQKLHVWNYRWFEGDCVWFQVSISDATGLVTDAGTGPDPACNAPNGRR